MCSQPYQIIVELVESQFNINKIEKSEDFDPKILTNRVPD